MTTTSTTAKKPPVTTTSTTPVKLVSSYVNSFKTTHGYYFSHDNRGFDKGQILEVKMAYVYSNGKTEIKDITKDVDFNKATPASTYQRSNITFKYDVQLYLKGVKLVDKAGKAVTVPAYIGVKGDANLSNDVDALDASTVLGYYAKVQTSPTRDKSIKLSQDDVRLDGLAAFLADVNVDEFDKANFKREKTDLTRELDALDASFILTYYAKQQTSNKEAWDIWNEVVPGRMLKK